MRLNEPRIHPLEKEDWTEEVREMMARFDQGGEILNLFKTLIHHPKLFKRWLVFSNHVLIKSSLPPRDREILILRIGWLCRSGYEWAQHVAIGKACGLTEADIQRIAAGPEAPGLSEFEALLIKAVDELHADTMIQQDTWDRLSRHYTPQQMMDVIFAVGQYNMVSMALNSLGVQLEDGAPRPDLMP